MIHRPDGIWTATLKRYNHSTHVAGLDIITTSVDIPLSQDTYLVNSGGNFDTSTILRIGSETAGLDVSRAWIKPDFSTIPAGKYFLSAILKLTPTTDLSSNDRTMRAHRCLRDVVSSQATWTIWKTANNWTSPGASSSGNDYDSTEMGNGPIPDSPTINVQLNAITFIPEELQKLYDGTYTNNGIVLFVDTQSNDEIRYASKDNATSGFRPVISIIYY